MDPQQSRKFKALDHNEKLLLYYFQHLDQRDQEDMLTFLKVNPHARDLPVVVSMSSNPFCVYFE